jgi:uncharacterized cupredoxin-like copper-binding protein
MRRLLLAYALASLAAACAPAVAGPGERTVTITIHHSAFAPAFLRTIPGETVRFVVRNTDPIDHEFIIGDEAVQDAHESGTEAYHPPRPGEITVPAGETVETTYTFGDERLIFGCHIPGHYAYGMRGLIEVG